MGASHIRVGHVAPDQGQFLVGLENQDGEGSLRDRSSQTVRKADSLVRFVNDA